MTVLSAMPCWFYDKKDLKRTPSIVEGLSLEQENRYRREGARFIINVGTKMGLRYDTMATGVVYFHRFYMFHSFRTFPRFITACCCLFLAGKVEETPKKCKDIIKVTKSFLTDRQFLQFGDDPKEEVMTLERILLQTIKFDLQVDHPYGHLLKYAKCLKGEKVKLEKMVQMAWTFINDSLCTTLSLQWEPEVIAIALMHLAGKLSKFEVTDWIGRTPKHSKWWDMYVQGMTIELLEDICHQVLDLYSTPVPETAPDSPPATPPSKSTILKVKPASPVIRTSSPVVSKTKEVPVGQPIPCVESGELKRKLESSELKRKLSKAALKKEMPEAKIPRLSNSASTSQSTSTASGPSSPKKSMQESETKRRSPESSEIKQPSIGHSIPTIETAYHTGLTGSSQPITTVPVMAEPIRTIITKPPAEPVHVQTNKTKKNPPPPPTFVVPEAVDNFYPEKHQSSSSRSSYSQNSQYMNPPNDPPLIQPPPPRPPPAQYENIYRPPPSLPVQPPPLPPPQAHYRPPPIHPMGQYPPPPAPLPQPSVMPNISLPPPNMPQMPPLPPSNVRNEHMHGAVANMAAPPLPSLSHGLARPRNASPLMSLPRPPPPRNYRPRPDVDSYGHDHRDEPERLPSPRLPMPIRGPPPRFMRGGPPPPHREGLPLPPPHREGLPLPPPPHREGLPLPPPHRDGPPPHHEYGHFDRERPPYRQPPQQQEPQYEREPPRDPYMEYDDFNNSRGPPQNQFEYDNMMRRRYPLEHHPQRNMERAPPPMLLNNRPRMESPTGIPPVRITGSSFDRFLE